MLRPVSALSCSTMVWCTSARSWLRETARCSSGRSKMTICAFRPPARLEGRRERHPVAGPRDVEMGHVLDPDDDVLQGIGRDRCDVRHGRGDAVVEERHAGGAGQRDRTPGERVRGGQGAADPAAVTVSSAWHAARIVPRELVSRVGGWLMSGGVTSGVPSRSARDVARGCPMTASGASLAGLRP